MSYDLASLMKMDVADLAELAVKYDVPMTPGMGKKELARGVYQGFGAYEATQFNTLLESENIWVDSSGMEHTMLSGQSYLQMGEAVNHVMPSEVAESLLASESGAATFAHMYRNPQTKLHNDAMAALRQAGVNPQDVWNQLPSSYRESTYVPIPKELKAVQNTFDRLTSGDHLGLDIMPNMVDHYGGNDEKLMHEFITPLIYDKKGNQTGGGLEIQMALEKVVSSYINEAAYINKQAYDNDVAKATRLFEVGLAQRVQAVGSTIGAQVASGQEVTTYYSDLLPSGPDDPIFKSVTHTQKPDFSTVKSLSAEMTGVAGVYGYGKNSRNHRGETGLSTGAALNDHLDTINELTLGTDGKEFLSYTDKGEVVTPTELSEAIKQVDDDYSTYITQGKMSRQDAVSEVLKRLNQGQDFLVPEGDPGFIGPMKPDIVFASDVAATSTQRKFQQAKTFSPATLPPVPPRVTVGDLTYHNLEQGTPEWHDLRSGVVTASMAGGLLGSNTHTNQMATVLDAVGYNPLGITNVYNHHFERGHKFEEAGRKLYEKKFGKEVGQTGFITNANYPGLGISPDGLVDDDGLVEFKAPAFNKFFDPASKPEYYDQVQMQMMITGRKWAHLAQIGGAKDEHGKEYNWIGRVDKIDFNPEWARENAAKLQASGRIIQEGKGLIDLNESGNMSNAEVLSLLTKAVASGTAEGIAAAKQVAAHGSSVPISVSGEVTSVPQTTFNPVQPGFEIATIPGQHARVWSPDWVSGVSPPNAPGMESVAGNPMYGYGRPVQPGFGLAVVDHGLSGTDNYTPNWTGPDGGAPRTPGTGLVVYGAENSYHNRFQQFSPNHHYQGGMKSGVAPGFGLGPSLAGGGGGNGAPPNWTTPNSHSPNMGPNDGPQPKYDADFNDVDLTQHGAASIDGSGNKNMAHLFGNDKGASKVSEAWGFAKDYYSDISGVLDWAIKAGKELNMDFTQSANVGMTNVNQFTESRQNFEAMGLDANAARGTTATMASAAAQLAAGDPSAASSIVVGSRGLLTLNDIRTIKDPSQLAALAARRAKERGLTQQQFAGRMQLAGLANLGVAYTMSDETAADIDRRSNSIMSMEDSDAARRTHSTLLSKGMQVHPGFLIHEGYQRGLPIAEDLSNTDGVIKAGKRVMDAMSGAVSDAAGNTINAAKEVGTSIIDSGKTAMDRLTHSVMMVESGGDKLARSKISTASGSMQVLNGTATDPGYGVTPARNRSPEELERVGKDYLAAMIGKFGTKAGIIAYTSGPGSVERRMAKDPTGWMDKLTAKERDYLAKVEKHYGAGLRASTQGANADHFAKGPGQTASNGQLKVTVDINGNTAKTNVAYNNKSVKKKDVNLNPGGQYDTAVG